MVSVAGPMLSVRDLTKTFAADRTAEVQAVRGISFEVPAGSFFVLLGPSGCGKTTTLRCIAGLERPDTGEIDIDGLAVVSARGSVPPEDRPIAMVFQSYAVWPHMSVYENVAFPLRRGHRRPRGEDIDARVRRALELVRLEGLDRRPVTDLSGGQQQRVAVARALALEPKVLLMDEPLSNLDAKLREQLRVELKSLMRRVGITTVYVTHDQAEALTMGDEIAVLDRGVVRQLGRPEAVYASPSSLFVARFLGAMNLVPGEVAHRNGGDIVVDTAAGRLRGRAPAGELGTRVLMGVRLEDVEIVGDAGENVISGVVRERFFGGESILYELTVGGAPFQLRLPPSRPLSVGQQVRLRVPPDRCTAFAPES